MRATHLVTKGRIGSNAVPWATRGVIYGTSVTPSRVFGLSVEQITAEDLKVGDNRLDLSIEAEDG